METTKLEAEFDDEINEGDYDNSSDVQILLKPSVRPPCLEEDTTLISIRKLTLVVLAFLVASHSLLWYQCHTNTSMPNHGRIRRGRYRVVESSLRGRNNGTVAIPILQRPTHHPDRYKDSTRFLRDTLYVGDIVETLERYDDDDSLTNTTASAALLIGDYYNDIVRVIYPTAGFLSEKILKRHLKLDGCLYDGRQKKTSMGWFQPTPLVYQGWWPVSERSERQYLYAPTILIVAQCLWNATQVFQIFFLLALGYYSFFTGVDNEVSSNCTIRKILVTFIVLLSSMLLPFSVYVISIGGHIFAGLTVLSALVALRSPDKVLRLSVGEDEYNRHRKRSSCNVKDDDSRHHNGEIDGAIQRSWMLVPEESLACLANLFSHMYNGRKPWWNVYAFVDRVFGLKNGGDVTPKEAFYMGRSNARIPLFVSQANHSSSHARVFLVLWSILPLLYTAYFGVMYLVAVRSPGAKIQRLVCVFGILNFLFCTDVVAYKYGRGYRSPHEELFHWWEHFAWRAAVLLPLYQNCTNGHWNHPEYPLMGKVFRVVAASYGIFFLVFQVIQCDMFRFVTFLTRAEELSFFELIGWEDHPVVTWLNLNTPKTWATMILSVVYLLLHFSGFSPFHITIRGEKQFYERLRTSDGHDNLADDGLS